MKLKFISLALLLLSVTASAGLTKVNNTEVICKTVHGDLFKSVGPRGAYAITESYVTITTSDYEYVFPRENCQVRIRR